MELLDNTKINAGVDELLSVSTMKKSIFVFLLLTGTVLLYAQSPGGTIPFDCPDVPSVTFQFNLNLELIVLLSTAEPFDAVENLNLHTYDAEEGLFRKLVEYYGEKLKQGGWASFAEDENWQISVLNDTVSKDIFIGIFAVIKGRSEVHLLNIVGQIPKEQIGKLLANLNAIGIWIPELRSLGETIALPSAEMETVISESEEILLDKKPVTSETEEILLDKKPVTMFRISEDSPNPFFQFSGSMQETHFANWTYHGQPIQEIQIQSRTQTEGINHKERVNAVKDVFFGNIAPKEDPEDLTVLLKKLSNSDVSKFVQKVTVNTGEKWVKIHIEDTPDEDGLIPLSKRYQTHNGNVIDEIQVEGNQSIETDQIIMALENGPVEIEDATQKLSKSIPEFEDVEVRIKKSGQQRIAVISVAEKPLSFRGYTTAIPRIGFNRVTGWEFGARVETGSRLQIRKNRTPFEFDWYSNIPIEKDTSKFFAQFGYGFGNKQLYYRVGGNRIWGKSYKWNLGLTAQFQRATATIAPDIYAGYNETGTFFLRLFGVPDHQDYYLRKGAEIALHGQLNRSIYSTVSLVWETHDTLQKTTDWHLLNWRSSTKVRENLVITPCDIRSINFKFDSNNRNNYLGWHNTFLLEHTNRVIGSDFDWTRFQTHLRNAYPFGNNQLRTRLVLSSVVGKPAEDHIGTALLPIQRQFIIGGIGTLNGYPLYTFAGDEGYLFNIELLFGLPSIDIYNMNVLENWHLVLLYDQAQVWNELESGWKFKPKASAGIGLQIASEVDILRFNVAKAFESEQGIQFNLMFFYSF